MILRHRDPVTDACNVCGVPPGDPCRSLDTSIDYATVVHCILEDNLTAEQKQVVQDERSFVTGQLGDPAQAEVLIGQALENDLFDV